jgi:hypothetical protein
MKAPSVHRREPDVGYHRALYVGAALLHAGVVVSVLTIRRPRHLDAPAVGEPDYAAPHAFEEAA